MRRTNLPLSLLPVAALLLAVACDRQPAVDDAAEPAMAAAETGEPAPELSPPTPGPADDIPHVGEDDPQRSAAEPPVVAADTELIVEGQMPSDNTLILKADLLYGSVLQYVVDTSGLVHYEMLGGPQYESALRMAVRTYASVEPPAETGAKLALWCNAYNANVLLLALEESRRPGFESVEKVEGFFDAREIAVAGETMTLNGLENDRIRPLGDPRIHAALVCAAMSCPPLRAEPYHPDRINGQFDDQCRRWINDTARNRAVDGRLALSRIFEWYAGDFEAKPFGGTIGFVRAYATSGGPLDVVARAEPEPEVTFLEYDWSLNQVPVPAGTGK